MLDYGLYPSGRVILSSFLTYPRSAGPREAVFTALCRKNTGCSHVIVGRDHAGVGSFYRANDARALFDELGDLRMEPVFFETVGYDARSERYVERRRSPGVTAISGTQIRKAIVEGVHLSAWMVRPQVQAVVRAKQTHQGRIVQD